MKGFKVKLLLMLLMGVFTFHVNAQQTSKTKASNKLYEKGGKVIINNATNINTSNLEFSPAFYQNGIVYATSRRSQGERDKKINETYFELFYSELDGIGLPTNPKEFSLEVNSHLHEGPVTFSRDGNIIYFTRNNIKKGIRQADSKGVTRLKIYQAERGPRDWVDVKELPFNSDDYSVCHPTLSANGKKLYFSSDMEGGQGGMDLWVSERQGEGWSVPMNLGADINTAKNEVFPFIHSSGNLFFSSNGHEGLGGLDLFMIDISQKVWSNINSLGEPFNSAADDLGIILNPAGTKGYFASARAGGRGKDDIYMFEAFDGVEGNTTPDIISSLINVYDAKTNDPIEGAAIRIFERTTDGFIGSGDDLYEAILMPNSAANGELVFKLVRKDAGTLGEPDRLSDVKGDATYDFMGESKYLLLVSKDGYASNEIAYATTGNVGAPNIAVPLSKVSCGNLSGIVKDRATMAALPNSIVKIRSICNGTEDVILTDREGRFNYCLPSGCDYVLTGLNENFLNGTKTVKNVTAGSPLSAEILLSPIPSGNESGLKTGSKIVLENIYYDFNKYFIRRGAAVELDELRNLMVKFPSMEIELSAHTDSRGKANYNQTLSEKRAESAKQFLVARGISGSRIVTRGYGESQLRNGCSDGTECSEEGHQYNRRTEVKILKIDDSINVEYHDHGPETIHRKH